MTTTFLATLQKKLGAFSNPDGAFGYFGENPGHDDEKLLIALYLPEGKVDALSDTARGFTTALIIGVAMFPPGAESAAAQFVVLLIEAIRASINSAFPEGLPDGCAYPWVQGEGSNHSFTLYPEHEITYDEVIKELRES